MITFNDINSPQDIKVFYVKFSIILITTYINFN